MSSDFVRQPFAKFSLADASKQRLFSEMKRKRFKATGFKHRHLFVPRRGANTVDLLLCTPIT